MKTSRSVLIQSSTCERLKQVGYKGETYDDVICHLLDLKNRKIGEHCQELETKE
jgi:hypothetical protein